MCTLTTVEYRYLEPSITQTASSLKAIYISLHIVLYIILPSITQTPGNSNYFLFPLKVPIIGSRLYYLKASTTLVLLQMIQICFILQKTHAEQIITISNISVELGKVLKFCAANILSINFKKTNYIIITSPKKKTNIRITACNRTKVPD